MADPVRDAIIARLGAIPGIGRVHAYQRYAVREKELSELYADGGQLRGWYVRRVAVAEKTEGNADNLEQTRWLLRGYMALNDATASELGFDALLDAVRAAFRADESLGGVILGGAAISLKTKDQAGIAVEDTGPVMFAGTLCHSATCSLVTLRWLEVP